MKKEILKGYLFNLFIIRFSLIIIFFNFLIIDSSSQEILKNYKNKIDKSNLSKNNKNSFKRDIFILEYQVNTLSKELNYSNKEIISLKEQIINLNNQINEYNSLISKNDEKNKKNIILISILFIGILGLIILNYYTYLKFKKNINNEKFIIDNIFNDYKDYLKENTNNILPDIQKNLDEINNNFINSSEKLLSESINKLNKKIKENLNNEFISFVKSIDENDILENKNNFNYMIEFEKSLKLIKEKKYDIAIKNLENIINIKSDFVGAYINLGICYQNINDINNSKKSYIKAIELEPNYYKTYFNLGLLYENTNDLKKAINCYKKVISLNNNHFNSIYKLAYLYFQINNLEESCFYYKKCIQFDNNNYYFYFNLIKIENILKKNEFRLKIRIEELINLYKPNKDIEKKLISLKLSNLCKGA